MKFEKGEFIVRIRDSKVVYEVVDVDESYYHLRQIGYDWSNPVKLELSKVEGSTKVRKQTPLELALC